MAVQSLWPEDLAGYLFVAALICAIVFPLIRGIFRRCYRVTPVFTTKNLMHDLSGGCLFPYCFILIFLPWHPGLLEDIAKEFFVIFGLLGMVLILRELADRGP